MIPPKKRLPTFCAPRFSVTLILAASLTARGSGLLKANAASTAKSSFNTLQFGVSARIVSLDKGKPNQELPPQTIAASVAIKGQNARIETESRARPVIFLLTPSTLTKLLPEQKAGVIWKIDTRAWTSTASSGAASGGATSSTRLTIQTLMSDPSAIRASLVRSGARKTGSGRLNGTIVDIYQSAKFGGKTQKMTAWLRHSDALPLRVQTSSPTLSSTLSWSNYRRVNLGENYFRVPSGYSMRQGSGQPYL